MKHYTNSLYCFQQLKVEIDKIKEALAKKDFYSVELIAMEEKEVLDFLKISRSTLYKYRKQNKLKAHPIFGRNIYLKTDVYEQVINQILK